MIRRYALAVFAGLACLVAANYFERASAQVESFVDPQVRQSQNGLLSTTLDLKIATHVVAGRRFEAATYEGLLPGPTLRVKPGDRLKIRFSNNLRLLGAPLTPQRLVTIDDVYERSMNMMRGMAHGVVSAAAFTPPDPAEQLYSNIHTHGLQVSPSGNADNPFLLFKPGETFDYEIAIPSDQPAGFDWYHPHKHGSSA